MGYLLPALTDAKLANQQDVVRNERRQRYEISPYGMVWVWLFENLYPEGHPYNIPTIGKHEDIENANMDDVHAFFKKWYAPNNASLVIAGDFDPAQAKELVAQYFGELPRGEDVSSITDAPAELTEEKVVRKEDPLAPHSKVWVAWLTPKALAEGDAEFDVFTSIFTEGKNSPLVKALVYEKQIAKDVTAFQYSARLQGQFIIQATAAEGHSTDELVAAIDEALAEIKENGVTEEQVQVSKLNWEKQFYQGLSSINRKADVLNRYNTTTGDPGYLSKDLARYLSVTPEAIATTINTYLNENRVVLHVTPLSETESIEETEEKAQ
jgi:zinc protease